MHLLWELFSDSPHLLQAVTVLQMALTGWMLLDAYHRRIDPFWYWIILLFQPIGVWIYFFAIKFRTMSLFGFRSGPAWKPKLSIDELRYRVERTPTVVNRLALAERLIDQGAHAEAIPYLEAVLAVESDYCAALHALAVCRLATGAPDEAVALLDKVIERDPRWANYRARRTLIQAHRVRGQPAEALKACREFEKRLPTLEVQCLLAEHLLENGIPSEAAELLDRALRDYQYGPWGARWRNWHWARVARQLLAEAEKGCVADKSVG
jgi:hypothetical protein